MPARTVVLEKLSKWNGETHADITPGEYTQLTGRAGRRGLDVEGHAVVLWQPGINPSEVAGLASTRTYPLRSSFRPSYNMAVNLVHQVGRERARELLEMSFAQFQADKAVVGLARQLTKSQDALAGVRRGGHLRPRRLHGVRRAPAAGLGAGEGCRPRPAGRPPRGGDRLAGAAPPRRRDRGAGRQVRRVRRRPRPRHVAGRPAAAGAHRRAAGAAAQRGGLPDAGDGPEPAADPAPVQPAQPADAARPGLVLAQRHPRPRPAATRSRTAATRDPTRDEDEIEDLRAPATRASRATPAPTARTTRAGRSGGSSSTATRGRCSAGWSSARTPWPGSSTGSATCWRPSATSPTTT